MTCQESKEVIAALPESLRRRCQIRRAAGGGTDPLPDDDTAEGNVPWHEPRSPLWHGPMDWRYRQVLIPAWCLAVAARWSLVPGQGESFGWTVAALSVAAVGLALQGGRIWWWCSAAALAYPLVFLRDWLTQSALMLAMSVLAGILAEPSDRGLSALRRGWVALVAGTYALSALHKTNADFFATDVSCAIEGWRRLEPWLGTLAGPSALDAWMAPLTWCAELALAVGVVWRPRPTLALAAGFHLGLTLTFEPAFPYVMGVGFAAALADDAPFAWPGWRAAAWLSTAVGAAAGFAAVWADAPLSQWHLAPRIAVQAAVCVYALAWSVRGGLGAGGWCPDTSPTWMRATALCLVLAWGANGLTPYAGTQMQHTGGMLSNLRIDEGCWNHLLVPEWVRGTDPYVRIDAASVGRGNAELEATLRTTLWSTTALRQMRRNWCPGLQGPLRLEGTFAGRPFSMADLCDPTTALPTGPGVWGGPGWFPDYLRLQKNLPRTCRPACMH